MMGRQVMRVSIGSVKVSGHGKNRQNCLHDWEIAVLLLSASHGTVHKDEKAVRYVRGFVNGHYTVLLLCMTRNECCNIVTVYAENLAFVS